MARFETLETRNLLTADIVSGGSFATIEAVVHRNSVDTVNGIGLRVRGLGDTNYQLAIVGNRFNNTNLLSGAAAVLIDDEAAGDATTINLTLLWNRVSNSNGADAYQLNQQDPGVFNIVGKEDTAQEVVANNNKGGPVTISGTVNVVPPAEAARELAWWFRLPRWFRRWY